MLLGETIHVLGQGVLGEYLCFPLSFAVNPKLLWKNKILIKIFFLKRDEVLIYAIKWGSPGGSVVKNPPASEGDSGLILGLGRSPGEGNGNPLQFSFLPGKYHGQRSLVGYSPWGHKRVGHDVETKQQQHNTDEPCKYYTKWKKLIPKKNQILYESIYITLYKNKTIVKENRLPGIRARKRVTVKR